MATDMLACYYSKYGGPEVDEVGRIPAPSADDLKEGQVLLEVWASSLNPADYKQRSGAQKVILKSEFPQVYGFDFSGQVVASKSSDWVAGDEVFGMCKGLRRGGLAEFFVVDGDICARKPAGVSHAQAAGVPLVGITAVGMLRKCGLKDGDPDGRAPRVLVLGGAGGVGACAIQLAKGLFGASFVATTASAGPKTEFVTSLGADRVVNYREDDFAKVLHSDDDAERFDAILDCMGDAKRCPPLLKSGGGLVSIAASPTVLCLREFLVASDTASFQHITFGVQGFLTSGIGGSIFDRVTGAHSLRAKCRKHGGTYEHVIGTGNKEIVDILAKELASGALKPTIDKVYPLEDALQALKHIEGGHTTGKVIVAVKPEQTQALQ